MAGESKDSWLKSKGYLHITQQIDVIAHQKELIKKIQNPSFISRYAFYPLIHSSIEERRYKKIDPTKSKRFHSYKDDSGEYIRNVKSRPLHYASHMDALILGYYANLIQSEYEKEIVKHTGLSDCIIAYRRIPSEIEGKNKSTIHFANEFFKKIKETCCIYGQCAVLTFDIKSFFPSLNHDFLKRAWCNLFSVNKLPPDHYNVFKASTQFSYIYLNDLKGHNNSFDEKNLSRIRNKFGINAFFESPKSFREQVKSGQLKIYKYPFRDEETKIPIGIPQGLPISAVLANLYLLSFDLKVLNYVVNEFNGYYRRYSDDIVIICKIQDVDLIEKFMIDSILESKVKISESKTEKFLFREQAFKNDKRLISIKIFKDQEKTGIPVTYLGFEFNGYQTLVKSANLAKFYRRMIYSIKSKAKRAYKLQKMAPGTKMVIFRNQLYKLYTSKPLKNVKVRKNWKRLERAENGTFKMIVTKKSKNLRSNYLSYVDRASIIMEEPAIRKQIRKHKKIFNEAIHKQIKHYSEKG